MVGTVADHMSSGVETLTEDAQLRQGVELVLVKRHRHVPVLDASGGLVGIVTDRDVMRALPSPLSPVAQQIYESLLDTTAITRVMTREPVTIEADAPLKEAVLAMLERHISGLPVLRDGALVGMLTQTDVLRAYVGLPHPSKEEV